MNRRKVLVWAIVAILVIGGIIWAGIVLLQPAKPPASEPPTSNSPSTTEEAKYTTVTVSNVTSGQTVSGVITFGADLQTNDIISRVEYFLDGTFGGVSYAAPFTFSLDTTTLSNGAHTIIVKAYNGDGAVATSKEITINVNNPPAATASQNAGGRASRSSAVVAAASALGSSGGSSGSGSSIPPPDTQVPSTPGGVLLAADDGYTANVTWNASTDNVGVTSYRIYRGGAQIGTSSGTSFKDQTVVPGNTYAYSVQAVDAAGNTSAGSSEPSITMVTTSTWIAGDTPASFIDDTGGCELGVKFKPLVNGKATGVRFYKAPGATGTGHTGTVWTEGGSVMATGSFSSETSSGWQSMSFASPVDLVAGTTYVVSYFAPDAFYGYTSNYFAQANGGITSQYLQVPGSTGSPVNGVFKCTSAGFPNTVSPSHTNYWADVNFTPNPNAGGPSVKLADNTKTYTGFPGTNNTGVPISKRLPTRDRKIDVRQDGAVVKDIEVHTEINVFANNVQIRNVRVNPTAAAVWAVRQNSTYSNTTIEDSEFYGTSTIQMQYGIRSDGSNLTVRRVNISCYANGIQANDNVTVEDTIVHSPCFFTGDHTDAFIATGGSGFTLTHNTFHNNLVQTSAIGLFCDFGPISNATISNNLLIGGGYAVYAGSTGTGNCTLSQNNKFLNNKFSREVWPNGGFNGPVNNYTALPGNEWTGNTWLDDGTPVLP